MSVLAGERENAAPSDLVPLVSLPFLPVVRHQGTHVAKGEVVSKQTFRIQLVQKEKWEGEGDECKRVRDEELLHDYEIFASEEPVYEDVKEEFRDKWIAKGLKPSEVEIRCVSPFHR